jgi:hypothetical protein
MNNKRAPFFLFGFTQDIVAFFFFLHFAVSLHGDTLAAQQRQGVLSIRSISIQTKEKCSYF